jgi:membrane-bound lytic murein transglycosylase D
VSALVEGGLPPDLWVLTIMESGMNTHARSHANAVGPWQFMSRTGRHYGLIISSDRDQRRDWTTSTRAAARYLAELQATFGDGLLALAAFNCGPSCVRRAIGESESDRFWDLNLPRETREYVPKALALIDLVGAGDRLPFRVDPEEAMQYEEAAIDYPVLIQDLARVCRLNSKQLKRLNPAWLRQVTPMDGHPVRARVPLGTQERVQAALASRDLAEATDPRVHRVESGESFWVISRQYDVPLDELLEANAMTGRETLHPGDLIRLPGRVHLVTSGDTLWGISRQYRVSLDELLELNGMTGKETLRPGRLLRVPG